MKSPQVSAPGLVPRKLPLFLGTESVSCCEGLCVYGGFPWRRGQEDLACDQPLWSPRTSENFSALVPGLPHFEFPDSFVGRSEVRSVGPTSACLPPGDDSRGRRVWNGAWDGRKLSRKFAQLSYFPVWSRIWKLVVPRAAKESSCFCFALSLELGPLFEKKDVLSL